MWYIIALSVIGGIVQSDDAPELRLPSYIRPTLYDLTITTYIQENVTFDGIVNITINFLNDTDTIILNSESLDIDDNSVVLMNNNGNKIKVSNVSFDHVTTRMFVQSSEILKSGNEYVLSIPFKGIIPDNYILKYTEKETNQTKIVVVTALEPADARKLFPCMDQPEFKAKFKISLGHSKNLKSFSNTKLKKTTPMPCNAEYVIDEYEESVLMSTYLVVFMITEFVYVDVNSYNDKVKMGIIVGRDLVSRTDYAKEYAPKYLKYYEDYTNVSFPLSKIDLAAIPNLYLVGGEYFGLITIGEDSFLIDSVVERLNDKAFAEKSIAYTFAEQWFGNLVTIDWWNIFWLKEGFATYSSICAVHAVHPDWNYMEIETMINFNNAMYDSFRSTLPITRPMYNQIDIERLYDYLQYEKIFYIFHMLNMFLGEETVKQGIQNYILQYQFSNANEQELWTILTEKAHRVGSLNKSMTVNDIMETWTGQSGYPILYASRDYKTQKVTLSQEWYISNGSDPDNRSWRLPLTMATSTAPNFNQTKPMLWLFDKKERTIPMENNVKWFIFNLKLTGLYRVQYDYCNWMSLISILNNAKEFELIHPLNRAQLILDSSDFSMIGKLDYKVTFELLKYLKFEKKFIPWSSASRSLGPVNKLLTRTPIYSNFQIFMQKILNPIYKLYGNMTKELKGYEEIEIQFIAIYYSCYYNKRECINQCLSIFDEWMNSPDPDSKYSAIVPKEMQFTVTSQAIRNGDKKHWDFLYERYLRSNDENQKSIFFEALCCSSDPWIQNRFLNWTIGNNATITGDEAWEVFRFLTEYNGFCSAKLFLFNNIKDIYEVFQGGALPYVAYYVDAIGIKMKTQEELIEFQQFINTHSNYLNGSEAILNHTIATINKNIKWMDRNYHVISSILKNDLS